MTDALGIDARGELHVEIVSPEAPLYSGPAGFVVAPAFAGELGILPGHAPLVARLGVGELRLHPHPLRQEGSAALKPPHRRFAVRGGFVQVLGPRVTFLVEQAIAPEAVDTAALDRALARIAERFTAVVPPDALETLRADRAWYQSQRRLARTAAGR